MDYVQRTRKLAEEVVGLAAEVRANLNISRKLLNSDHYSVESPPHFGGHLPNMGCFTWFVSGNLFHGDRLFASLHGLELSDLRAGLSIESLLSRIPEAQQQHLARALHAAIMTGDRCVLEYATLWPDNGLKQIVLIGSCLRNEEGVPSFFCGVVFEKNSDLTLDWTGTFKAHCDAAIALARQHGNLLAAKYLQSGMKAGS